jgi:hypothetical protein
VLAADAEATQAIGLDDTGADVVGCPGDLGIEASAVIEVCLPKGAKAS